MEINRKNFLEYLPLIEKSIDESDFIAIDTELTGLTQSNNNLFDTIEQRYQRMKEGPENFSIIQFGLSCFKQVQPPPSDQPPPAEKSTNSMVDADGASNGQQQSTIEYDCYSYNIFVFPYKISGGSKVSNDRSLRMQASALAFLVSHKFDFNKLFSSGINWLNVNEQHAFEEFLKRTQKLGAGEEKFPNEKLIAKIEVPADEREFINETLSKLNEFLADVNAKRIDLPRLSAFKRRLIYQIIENSGYHKFVEVCTVQTPENFREKSMYIEKCSNEDRQRKQSALLNEVVGMSKIIQHLIKRRRPIIGHNLLLDLMHIMHQFVAPLPADFASFLKIVADLFPALYDTKYLATLEKFKEHFPSTGLEDLYKSVQKFASPRSSAETSQTAAAQPPPFPLVKINHRYNENEQTNVVDQANTVKYHEASYDSYITGYVYACFAKSLSNDLEQYQNRLAITYIYDLHFISLNSGECSTPSREYVFHVKFPAEWNTQKLVELFSPYSSIAIGWINDCSAFVALKDRSKISEVKNSFIKQSSNAGNGKKKKQKMKKKKLENANCPYKVQTYAKYIEQLSSKTNCSNNVQTTESESSSNCADEELIPIEMKLRKTKVTGSTISEEFTW